MFYFIRSIGFILISDLGNARIYPPNVLALFRSHIISYETACYAKDFDGGSKTKTTGIGQIDPCYKCFVCLIIGRSNPVWECSKYGCENPPKPY